MIDTPELCKDCKAIVESSNLKWVHVGGMAIGLHRQPLQWVLRDKYSSDMMKKNADTMQKLAAKCRENAKLEAERDRYKSALEEIVREYIEHHYLSYFDAYTTAKEALKGGEDEWTM